MPNHAAADPPVTTESEMQFAAGSQSLCPRTIAFCGQRASVSLLVPFQVGLQKPRRCSGSQAFGSYPGASDGGDGILY